MTAPIDLRSDTVTRPTDAMRAAMAAAPVGDDQYGEDPSTNRLQARMAEWLGKEAALWLPSGTMSNQVALKVLTRPGDEVVASRESHAAWHEVGGAAANAGVQIVEIGRGGVFSVDELDAAIKPAGLPVFPQTTLMEIENTHNRAGGVVVPQPLVLQLCAAARARAWAASWTAPGCGTPPRPAGCRCRPWPRPFDLVSVAFSKGLGAPGGSLAGGVEGAHRGGRPAPPPHGRGDAAERHLQRRRAVMRWTTTWTG
jgi:threonine aldolase